MSIDEYRKQFIDNLRFDAEHEGTDPESQFINKTLEQLEDIGELNDPMPMSIEIKGRRGRIMSFDAYAYDEADSALCLIASDFLNDRDSEDTLVNSHINDLCAHMLNFVDESVNGHMSDYCDDSDPAIILAREFKKRIGKTMLDAEIMRFKLFIISNKVLSKQVKNVTKDDFLDRPVELNVWTLERFYQTFESNSSEIIEFSTSDFNCAGIQCIKADLGVGIPYDAYMGIVPGRFLADIYLKYGSKLLQGNVRAFLSVRGKVNQGIRKTIINTPGNFFTYNNGIAVVARSVKFSPDGTKIIHFRDPQIINGGQTTASLANAIIKKEDKNGMDNLFVPMKLTVLNIEDEMSEEQIEQYNSITRQISECANTQNPVSGADFFSNHPFHVLMENLSANIFAPPVDGTPYPTRWFYERSRGKWEQEQMKLTPAQTKHFREKCPKKQLVKKEKLAKCLNTIECNPHQVAAGSAYNMKYYSPRMIALYEKSKDSINEVFFKKAMASVIIFDEVDSLVNKSEWYPVGGNKAQIVPYTIAKIVSMVPKDKSIDYNRIWQKQHMYPSFVRQVEIIAPKVHQWLLDNCGGVIVREFAKKADTWKNFQDYRCSLTDAFIEDLVSADSVKDEERAAKKRSMFDSNIDLTVQIYKKGAAFWLDIAAKLNKYKLLSYGDREFVSQVASICQRNSLLSTKQAYKLKKIIEKAVESGLIIEE